MVLPVSDPNITIIVEGNPPWLVELPVASATLAAFRQEFTVRVEDLEAIVAAVDDNEVPVFLAYQASGAEQFTVTAPRFAPFPEEVPTRIEYRDRILPLI